MRPARQAAYRDFYRASSFDPFFATEEDIARFKPDVVLRAGAYCSLRAFVRRSSLGDSVISGVEGVRYLRNEKAYYLPIRQLNRVLATLMHRQITFAVSLDTANRLANSADVRRSSLSLRYCATTAEMKEAFLSPILEYSSNKFSIIELDGLQKQELKEALGLSKNILEGQNLSRQQMGDLLLSLVTNAVKLDIWFSAAAQKAIFQITNELRKLFVAKCESNSTSKSNLPNWTIGFLHDFPVWFVVGNMATVRASQPEISNILRSLENAIPTRTVEAGEQMALLSIGRSNLPDYFEVINKQIGGDPVQTNEFRSLFQRAKLEHDHRQRMKKWRCMVNKPESEFPPEHKQLVANLFPHQRVALDWLLNTPYCLLGDDMGLGKTITVLAAFELLRSKNQVQRLLVISPNSLVRNWLREASRWLPHRNFVPLPKEKKARKQFLEQLKSENVDGIVLNYECARILDVSKLLVESCGEWRTFLCLDESQRVKNSYSRSFRELRKLVQVTTRRVLLSGTPAPKDLTDLWSQMYMIDGGMRLGRSYFSWLNAVANLGNKWSSVAVSSYKPLERAETLAALDQVLLRRRKEQVVDLPEKLFSVRDIELKGEQLERYEEVRKDLLVRLVNLSGEQYLKSISSILEQYLRAVQIASNPRLIDENWKGDPAKFVELDEIVAEVVVGQSGKLVIWTNYLKNVVELVKRYNKYGAAPFSGQVSTKERQETVAKFQDLQSSIQILVAVPAAGGVGITLTAAQSAVYVDKTWNAEHWLQSIDRIHRIGQTGTVNIISLHAGRVDELIAKNLTRKSRFQSEILGDPNLDRDPYPSKQEMIEALS